MTTPAELSRHFDQELNNLKQDLLRMAALAEQSVALGSHHLDPTYIWRPDDPLQS